jgi:hypothetical protein
MTPAIGGRGNRRPVPDDFAARAPSMTYREAWQHWGCGWARVKEWYELTGLSPRPFKNRPIPADLAEIAPTMTLLGLSRHYEASPKTVRKWLDTTGVDILRLTKSECSRLRWGPPKPKPPKRVAFVKPAVHEFRAARDTSLDGLAAEHLRALAPTYRCDERGRAHLKGKFWRFGNTVFPPTS